MVRCVTDVSRVVDVVVVGASGIVVSRGVCVENPVVGVGSDEVGVDVVEGVGGGQGSLPLITVWLMQIA